MVEQRLAQISVPMGNTSLEKENKRIRSEENSSHNYRWDRYNFIGQISFSLINELGDLFGNFHIVVT